MLREELRLDWPLQHPAGAGRGDGHRVGRMLVRFAIFVFATGVSCAEGDQHDDDFDDTAIERTDHDE